MESVLVVLISFNLIIAIAMYMACKEMNNKLARLMMFLFCMTPSLSTIIQILIRRAW